MNLAELLNEYTTSRSEFSQVLNDSTIRMGFECELVTDIEQTGDDEERGEEAEAEAAAYHEVSHNLATALNVHVTTNLQDTGNNAWYIKADGSIKADGYFGAEIASGVYTLKDGLGMLQRTFQWMIAQNYRTNQSTGFHVSFSIEGKTDSKDYDFLKMMILFDENYTANLFSRMGQEHAMQMREVLFRDMRNRDPASIMNSRNIGQVMTTLRKLGKALPSRLGFEKKYSFRHRNDGVIEFRGMGGSDYEKQYDVIRTRIINMAFMMKVGSDDSLMQREYLARIYRMLTGNKYASPEIGKQTIQPSVPYMLNSFALDIQRNSHLAYYASEGNASQLIYELLQVIAVRNMTLLQKRQLRFYLLKNKIDATTLRDMLGDDATYNPVANLMHWPLVVPGDHDEDQSVMPFALHGSDRSGEPGEPDPEAEEHTKQSDLPGASWTSRNPQTSVRRRRARPRYA